MERKYETEEMQIDLIELFYVLRSKILVILLAGVIFGGIAFGYAKFMVTPQYTSTSMMLVLSKDTTLTSIADLQLGTQLTKDYSVLVTSRPVLTEVVDDLKLGINYKALRGCVTVTNPSETRFLEISVQYSDPKKAKEITDKIAEVASEYIGEQMEVVPPKIIEKGEVPTGRSDRSVTKTMMIGALIGMILCAGIVILRSLMDDTIQTEDDIEKYLGLSTLSVIPDRKDYINGTRKKKSKK